MNKTLLIATWITVLLIGIVFISCEEDQSPATLPATPKNIKDTVLSSSQITIRWKDLSDNEDGFRIERARLDSFYFSFLTNVGANATSYTDTGLTQLTTYMYRVYAFNSAGLSKPSSVVVGKTLRTPVVPNAPLDVTAVPVSNTSVLITWQDNSSDETGFKIERALPGSSTFYGLDTVTMNKTIYLDQDLQTNSTYQYRIRAFNDVGFSDYSNSVSATPGTNVVTPLSPTNLNAVPVSPTQIALSWTDNSSNEDGFKIERAPLGTSLFNQIAVVTLGTTSYRDKNLQVSTGYTYRMLAYNSIGNSGYSYTSDATTFANSGAPLAPSDLKAIVKSATQIWLSWNDDSNNEDYFLIERAPGLTSSDYVQIGSVAANETTYEVKGLTPSTGYSFRIRSSNIAGSSSYTNIVSRTTSAVSGTPTAPSRLQISEVTALDVQITWTDNSTNEDGYYVERAPTGTHDFVQLATLDVGSKVYTDYQVEQSTGYQYRVRAFNTAGTSTYSNTVSATTLSLTQTQFVNGTSHSIVSLIIDGLEYLPAPQSIPPGSYLAVPLSPGRHYYSMKNGYWTGLMPTIIYSDTAEVIQQQDMTGSVAFNNPTIFQIMAKFNYTAFWQAKFNSGQDSVGYRFFSDGSYFYYQNGFQKRSGLYSIVSYNADQYTITFTVGDYQGVLSEQPGDNYFIMPNGPTGNPNLTYYYTPQ